MGSRNIYADIGVKGAKGRFREISLAQIKTYLKRLEIDEDPLAVDLSGYLSTLKWRKSHFKIVPKR